MTKLTDTQLVVLSAASNREDGSILPLPANLKGGAAGKVVDGLIRRGLAERIESDRPAVPDLVRITRAGLEALGVEADDGAQPANEAPSAKPAPSTRRGRKKAATGADKGAKARGARADSKQAKALDMLRRPEGVSNEDLQEAFGWRPHTVRGFIAGAVKRKLGLDVTSEKVEGRGRVYKLAEAG